MIIMGNHLVSNEEFNTLKEVQAKIKRKDWDLLLIASAIYNEHVQEYKQSINNSKK